MYEKMSILQPKKIFYITLISLLFIIYNLIFGISFAIEQKIIAVVKSKNIESHNIALDGFNKVLEKSGVSIKLNIYELGERNIVENIKLQKPDLILTLGTSATKEVSDKINNIPIIFSMVMDAEGNGIKTGNITGSSLDIPIKIQFKKLKKIIPKVKRIGVIYNPEENKKFISKAVQIANDLGIILKTYPVKFAKEIPKMEEMGIDALWLIPDTIVCQPAIIRNVILSSIRNKIPIMGISPYYVKAGILMALSCDYEDIGCQSGEIAVKILKREKPSNIPISVPRKIKLFLNLSVAERLGIEIPENIIKEASEVFGR